MLDGVGDQRTKATPQLAAKSIWVALPTICCLNRDSKTLLDKLVALLLSIALICNKPVVLVSQQAREEEQAPAFVKARRAHSAVESAINGLEVHGLDVCRGHGIEGFKRYVALAVLAQNIHRIGAILWQQDVTREQHKNSHAKRYKSDKRTA